MSSYLMPTYNPLPIAFIRGEGSWLIDKDNNRYLDALGGIAVTSLGHAHPNLVNAIKSQAEKVLHLSNVVTIPEQYILAEKLCKLANMDQAFFCNSGAEANECALKIARMFGHNNNIENPQIIVADKAFHGRTLATLSASGNRKVQAGFEPLVQGFLRVPFDDIPAIEEIAKHNKNVVAILLEPIQGEGGVNMPSKGYFTQVRKICSQNNWLFMLDEIQSGIGRTGKWFGFQHYDFIPDVISLAKGLGGGIPIGACLAAGPAKDLLQFGNHGTTFGGNPLCCHAATTVLETIEKEHLCENSAKLGKKLLEGLQQALKNLPQVKAVRGQGLWIGIELNRPAREILNIGLKHHLLFSITAINTIRLAPALNIKPEEVEILINTLPKVIAEFGET
ncbi:MAG: aspartate aminotransferase family protein [Gammaproteobacteria bacterium]|nr:aspartate aminotransferase family protein [Gammaproteobacteria bacterium]